MSSFDDLDDVLSATVDTVNAIPFTLTPMKRPPNGRAEVDLDRSILQAEGILDLESLVPPLELGNRDRRGNDLRSLVNGTKPILSIDRSWFPTAAQEPRQGDRIEFTDRQDLPTFYVVSVERDGLSRLEVQLVRG